MLITHFSSTGTTAGDRLTSVIPVVTNTALLSDVQALFWKEHGHFDTIRDVYVVDENHRFVGSFQSREIFRHPLHTPVHKVMHPPEAVCIVQTTDDQEYAVKQALHYNVESVVVVQADHTLAGAISIKELLKILLEETQEDLAAFGRFDMSPRLDNILEIPLFEAFRNRLPWMLVGLVGGIAVASIVSYFEPVLSAHLILASFIPLAVYITGAVSAQLQLNYIRDLAFYPTLPFKRYLTRQSLVIVCLAAIITTTLLIVTLLFKHLGLTGLVIAGSIGLACLSAIITGIFVPATLAKFIKDPANATTPIATIISDAATILIFFGIAQTMLL